MRYTPAGLPALDLQLEHESQVMQAGLLRSVKASFKAKALGTEAEKLAQQALGSAWQFTGFLASAPRGKNLIFHIQQFQAISS